MKSRILLLTVEDIKSIKYRLRPGIIFPIMLFFLSLILLLLISLYDPLKIFQNNAISFILIYLTLSICTSLLISFILLHKPLKDIASGEKKMVQRIITKKEKIVSEEAGSGTLYLGQKMKRMDVYAIIVDHTRYKIEKEVYDNCEEGETVGFHYTVPANWLIRIGE